MPTQPGRQRGVVLLARRVGGVERLDHAELAQAQARLRRQAAAVDAVVVQDGDVS